MTHPAYETLVKKVRETSVVRTVEELLEWDQEVAMPKSEATLQIRGLQQETLAKIHHELETSPTIGNALAVLSEESDLTPEERALVREVQWRYNRETQVPNVLASSLAALKTEAQEAWKNARGENDYGKFAPYLERMVEACRQRATYINPNIDPYEVLLQDYESGLTLDEMRSFLGTIKDGIRPLLDDVCNARQPDDSFLRRDVSENTQMMFCKDLARKIGFDFSKGRLDVSTHPFTGADYGRITTRFSDGWWSTINSMIHEVGHGKYEHNLPLEYFGTPLGSPRSLSVHESQSRLWENQIGKSEAFWEHFFPQLQSAYAPTFNDVSVTDFLRAVNKVGSTLIRVNADELTYNLHVILRFELEQDLINGRLAVRDVPEAWNAKMQESLGIRPPTDAQGCLQDVHWSCGSIGYFSTYVVGSMLAAQEYVALKRDIPDLDDQIVRGEFGAIDAWLQTNIHRHGCRYSTKELIERATGKPPNPEDYLSYLNTKFRRARNS